VLSGPRRPAPSPALAVSLVLTLAAGSLLLAHGRSDVLDSLSARLHGLRGLFEAPPLAVLFGRGIGLGTNAGSRLLGSLEGGESAVSALVLQTGLAGLALFAAALGLAWARLAPARPLLLALAAACLTLSVPEAFPVNLLLGVVLACDPSPKGEASFVDAPPG
jgi:hypothetical protein